MPPSPGAGISPGSTAGFLFRVPAAAGGRAAAGVRAAVAPMRLVPTSRSPAGRLGADADGNHWFTEWGANRIGRITPDGRIDEHDLPSPASEPHGITQGSDGAMWTALEIGTVARLTAP
ncbi:Virginiamycin B lyase [Streptomyces microflavus DSM 40593]|uniref:Virginiamycin B lyase n=1 Tax=Streptomyces microflavus DSM 40593 TaxID=1303692 RepID=N0CG47_STRMI|nr:Virginiamycin B lyase [Streptomyces microflavus DSM 40593]